MPRNITPPLTSEEEARVKELGRSGMNANKIARSTGLSYKRVYLALEGIRIPYSRIKREDERRCYPEVIPYTREETRELLRKYIQRQYDSYNKGSY